jgi:phenylacetic acid degradation operon negative regulatory protein
MANMLHFLIVMNKLRDIDVLGEARPLNARSLALSALLGTHPPTLPASGLVALAELFGINGGTMRTALSRMVTSGDVSLDEGMYRLSERLQQRQVAQEVGRNEHPTAWDGTWHTAVALADQRDLSDRRQVRVTMANARFAELRPTVWMRPANLALPSLGGDWVVTTGPTSGPAGAELTGRLWDLRGSASVARHLIHELEQAETWFERSDPGQIPRAFNLSAVVVRFLRSDPLLPTELVRADWPVPALRRRYGRFESQLQSLMRPVLRPG